MEWIEAEWPTRYSEYGNTTTMPLSALFNMAGAEGKAPALVYVHELLDDEKTEKVEKKMFGSEDLVIASRFFRLFRINESDVPDPTVRKKYLKKLPAFVFLDGKGNIIDTAGGKLSARSLVSKLGKLYKGHFDGTMSRQIKAFQGYLDEVTRAEDKAADMQRLVDGLQQRIDKSDSKSAKRQLTEKKAELEKLQKTLDDLLSRRNEFLPKAKTTVAKN